MTKADILAFFKTQEHTVISTCSLRNEPEAALIGFGETEQLEIVFGTSNLSRKYQNLKENPKVAFVVGWDDDFITIQYEGIATEIFGEEMEKLVALYHHKVPSAAVYHTKHDQTYFKVTPTWIRYSDYSGDKDQIVEFSFDTQHP